MTRGYEILENGDEMLFERIHHVKLDSQKFFKSYDNLADRTSSWKAIYIPLKYFLIIRLH